MGGGERVAIHSMLAAAKMGNDVTLLSEEFDTTKFEDFFGCDGLFDSVKQLTFAEFKPLIAPGFLLYQRLFYYQTQFRKVLGRHSSYDIVLGTQDVGYVPTTKAPIVQYCYFPEYFQHLQSKSSSLLWKMYYRPASIFYRNRVSRINRFLAVSNYTKEFVKAIWARDSITLYPPCPVEMYKSQNSDAENLAITIGRIVPEKRMHLFLEMAKRLPQFKFVIIGSVANPHDSYYRSLVNNASNNLSIILSPLRKNRDLLAKAKVYVHCAENEHFGITIVEAMASGCVPVVHDSGGPREIVTRDVGFKWHDAAEAADQILRVMSDTEVQRRMSTESSKRASLYSDDSFESSLIRILRAYESSEKQLPQKLVRT